jgi:hypothetical protein
LAIRVTLSKGQEHVFLTCWGFYAYCGEKEGCWRGWALGKVSGKEVGGGIAGKVIRAGQLCVLVYFGSLIRGSHV